MSMSLMPHAGNAFLGKHDEKHIRNNPSTRRAHVSESMAYYFDQGTWSHKTSRRSLLGRSAHVGS